MGMKDRPIGTSHDLNVKSGNPSRMNICGRLRSLQNISVIQLHERKDRFTRIKWLEYKSLKKSAPQQHTVQLPPPLQQEQICHKLCFVSHHDMLWPAISCMSFSDFLGFLGHQASPPRELCTASQTYTKNYVSLLGFSRDKMQHFGVTEVFCFSQFSGAAIHCHSDPSIFASKDQYLSFGRALDKAFKYVKVKHRGGTAVVTFEQKAHQNWMEYKDIKTSNTCANRESSYERIIDASAKNHTTDAAKLCSITSFPTVFNNKCQSSQSKKPIVTEGKGVEKYETSAHFIDGETVPIEKA